ncbi:MAG TPA: hypothetical protein VKR43_17910 [Bryobacteraceae bacterium]|nr:hypothetical protein [Bryobacteraceae bacterium]
MVVFRKAYDAALTELDSVVRQLDELKSREATLRTTIKTLAAQCRADGIEISEPPSPPLNGSLAEQIRVVLRAEMLNPLRPNELMAKLKELDFDFGKYRNPQAAVQMFLKRMTDTGEIRREKNKEGKSAYRYTRLAERLSAQFLNTKIKPGK